MNKLIVVASVLIISTPVLAGVNSKKIYNALDVQEANITPSGEKGYILQKKEVGGLSCFKKDFLSILKKSQFTCTLSVDEFDAGTVYNSLNVDEENATPNGLIGSATFEKTVGSLTCTKSFPVVPNPTYFYSCRLEK